MKMRGRWLAAVAVVLLAVMAWRWFAPAGQWREGDIIFQTSRSQQSAAIAAATLSAYTHMGILAKKDGNWVVIEATGPVKETPVREWIKRGRLARYAVYRHKTLTTKQAQTVTRAARQLKGRPYDLYFSFENRAIYCSELAWLAFKAADTSVGKVETIGALSIGNAMADKLIQSRGARDPECAGLGTEACRTRIVERELVTPVAIAHDRNLRQVFSNYPL